MFATQKSKFNQVSEHTVGKVRRLAEDVEALRAEEADEKKVPTMMMMERVMLLLKRETMMLKM